MIWNRPPGKSPPSHDGEPGRPGRTTATRWRSRSASRGGGIAVLAILGLALAGLAIWTGAIPIPLNLVLEEEAAVSLDKDSTPPSPAASESPAAQGHWPPVATFSILGYDPETGEVGGAVQSRVFSVGNGVLWAEAGVGVVATQAIVDVSYGPQALALLRDGMSPEEVVPTIWERDPDPRPDDWSKEGRQFSVMDAGGAVETFTGPRASDWAGHRVEQYVSAQGNILAGPEVVDRMVEAFEATEGHLSLRLQAALEAGQAAGGDTRGKQSAAMIIVQEGGGVWLNNDVVLRLQVDDHAEPITELRRLVELAAEQRERIRASTR
jgi:uncharacterized Ntn-hydrolase superfamily protein